MTSVGAGLAADARVPAVLVWASILTGIEEAGCNPVGSGEPRMGLRVLIDGWVYPPARGGTRIWGCLSSMLSRSIPARAGLHVQ